MIDLLELIADFFLEIQQFFFKRKKKKRRKFEKENNLPKKRMVSPYQRVSILIGIVFGIFLITVYFIEPSYSKRKTTEKLKEIEKLLDDEKKFSGFYPEKLHSIIRNNPLRVNIVKDYWKNDFKYKQLENGKSYELFSLGKDEKPNTKDDIKN